ncbi:MAG: type VI secretion system contractile sheath large subunit, partial [Acidobacteriota bacterium]|nr:type VI secretion system contractile sheath large subunit [Acidobacteriota bacterium]
PPTNALAPDAPAVGGLLDYLIEESESRPRPQSPAGIAPEWNEMLRDLVKPHLVSIDLDEQEGLVASVDNCIGGLMRMILHHPDFQALEAAWRAVHFLVSRLETDSELKVFLLDVSKDELTADLTTEDLRATNCYQLFVEQSAETLGGEPWALFAGNYVFDSTRDGAVLLGRIGKVARAARAPFIAGASPQILGCDSLAQIPDPREWRRRADDSDSETWNALRKLPEAEYLGLALPRFLLRLPYGESTEQTEQFSFEETTEAFTHENYLWGNPTFACAYLLAQSFSESGWDLRPGQLLDVEDLPLHVYEEGGESQLKPCAETVLTERAAEAILDRGLMPLLSFKNEDRARLAGFRSLATPPTSLAGRWQS